MEDIIISPYILSLLFFVVAFVYTSVGLAGGSSYIALMAIFGINTIAIPMLALTLNVFASSIGSFNFIRNKHARLNLILPFFISSIPMSYLGGSLNVQKELFYWLLLISLIIVALRIYVWDSTTMKLNMGQTGKIVFSLLSGSVLGLVSGIVGIGGGIYLIPLIIIFGLGTAKEAAACGAIFIWANSVSGLISRLQYNMIDLSSFVFPIIAVIAGSTLGSFMGATKLSPKTMQKVLGVIIIVAIALLLRKVLTI